MKITRCLLDSKKVVGSVTASTYPSVNGSRRLTTIGMFFVLPAYRGLRIGMELFNRLLSNPEVLDNNKGLTGGKIRVIRQSVHFRCAEYSWA